MHAAVSRHGRQPPRHRRVATIGNTARVLALALVAATLPRSGLATMITVPVLDMNQAPLGEIKVWADDMIPDVSVPPSTPPGKGPRFIETERTGAVLARFQHNKTSNVEAAEAAWGGHFQWLNIVTSDTGDNPEDEDGNEVQPPYIDPLPGESSIFVGDRLPFFWDEKDPLPNTPEFEGDTPDDADLDFGDGGKDGLPEFADAPTNDPDGMVEFETWLVSVPGDIGQMENMTFHLLAGFKWKVNEGPGTDPNTGRLEGDESISVLMPLTLTPGNVISTVIRIDGVLAGSGFADWMTDSHLPAPEPGSLALLGIGLAGLGFSRRKLLR